MSRVFARIRVELGSNGMKYRLLFEIVDTDGTIKSTYPIPSLAIIDTFKQMAIAEADGYTDSMASVIPIRIDDSKEVDNT